MHEIRSNLRRSAQNCLNLNPRDRDYLVLVLQPFVSIGQGAWPQYLFHEIPSLFSFPSAAAATSSADSLELLLCYYY